MTLLRPRSGPSDELDEIRSLATRLAGELTRASRTLAPEMGERHTPDPVAGAYSWEVKRHPAHGTVRGKGTLAWDESALHLVARPAGRGPATVVIAVDDVVEAGLEDGPKGMCLAIRTRTGTAVSITPREGPNVLPLLAHALGLDARPG